MNKILSAITGSPFFLYAKLFLVVALVGGAAYLAYDYRDAKAEVEKKQAVEVAVRFAVQEANQKFETERALRILYQGLADDKLTQLLKSISNIKVEHKTIENNIYQEVEREPAFYGQKLPDKGYEAWKRARNLPYIDLQDSSQPSAPPSR